MSLTEVISQYFKLYRGSNGGLMSIVSKLFKDNDSSQLISSKLLTNLSPEMIQKLSALRSLGKNQLTTIDSSDNFIHTFQQLANKFANKDTHQQIEKLAKPENANYLSNAIYMAKKFGINLDHHL